MVQQPIQPGQGGDQNRRYTVKNARTGETKTVTEQEYRDQNLEQAGFAKPDKSSDES